MAFLRAQYYCVSMLQITENTPSLGSVPTYCSVHAIQMPAVHTVSHCRVCLGRPRPIIFRVVNEGQFTPDILSELRASTAEEIHIWKILFTSFTAKSCFKKVETNMLISCPC